MALLLVAGGVGCYRATGEARPTTVAEQIPANGGDRVGGMKATAGPGDYYLGNDYIQMAVDGAPYGSAKGQFGAPSGGSILDIGGVALDTAYKRVSLPTDNVERLGPVVNQDPDLPLVFDSYNTTNTADLVTLTMKGYLLDPLHKLAGASWDSNGKVQGVTVTHSISLQSHALYFTLDTELVNNSGAALPIQSLGDFLSQRGGGFRFIVPANQDASGAPLSTWGLDIPGSDFTQPLATSVRAPMIALQGAEPSADDLDSHQSLGILPLTVNASAADQVMVASDPQTTLSEDRPIFPARLVVGSPSSGASMPSGTSLSYQRRLYGLSGNSLSVTNPAAPDGVMNLMEAARKALRGTDYGVVSYFPGGTAAIKGYRQTEIRFERFIGDTTTTNPVTDTNSADWSLERLAIPDSGEVPSSAAIPGILLPAVPDPAAAGAYLPYRVVVTNRNTSTVNQELVVTVTQTGAPLLSLLRPSQTQTTYIVPGLSAEMGTIQTQTGTLLTPVVVRELFTLQRSGDAGATPAFLPGRFTFQGLDASGNPDPSKDPDFRRNRFFAGYFNPVLKAKATTGTAPGDYLFTGGNSFFGSIMLPGVYAAPVFLPLGTYNAIASHGPFDALAINGVPSTVLNGDATFPAVMRVYGPPSGWSTFDAPGPSQRTTGGMLPAEQLSSALAENVDVVGRTESDAFTDGSALRKSFRSEFKSTGDAATDAAHFAVIGQHPFVVSARSSSLGEGTFTTLFTQAPDHGVPFGGALQPDNWSAADFVAMGGGGYVIANRPCGPQGLFTSHPVAAGVALGTGANSWWTSTDPLSNGHQTGEIQAIELLRAEGCNPADPSAWFAEFQAVRSNWFNLLNLQTPTAFTKGLGLSSGVYSLDTPVGLARTYLKLGSATPSQSDLSSVKTALESGAAVASTGPLLDVTVGGQGPGGLATGASVTLTANLWFATWIPVDEIRVVVNGSVVQTLHLSDFTQDSTDARHWSASITVPMSTDTGGKDGWIVVEAGVPLSTTGAYAAGTPWNRVMKGIYPVAVTNPIFVDVNGGGYTPPLP